jgi:hypothetical protein
MKKPKSGPNPDKRGMFRWVVEIGVDEKWVEDGFDLDDAGVQDMMENRLGWATSSEVKGRVLSGPSKDAIKKVQSGQ